MNAVVIVLLIVAVLCVPSTTRRYVLGGLVRLIGRPIFWLIDDAMNKRISFSAEFGWWAHKSEPKLEQDRVDLHLKGLGTRFHNACRCQTLLIQAAKDVNHFSAICWASEKWFRDGFPTIRKYASFNWTTSRQQLDILQNDIAKYKKWFWAAHNLAKRQGYVAFDSIKAYDDNRLDYEDLNRELNRVLDEYRVHEREQSQITGLVPKQSNPLLVRRI